MNSIQKVTRNDVDKSEARKRDGGGGDRAREGVHGNKTRGCEFE